jgi:hypothetical protein
MQMDEPSALALVRNNIGRHKKSVAPLQLAKAIRYLYELYGRSCTMVASRANCDENTIQLWVRLSEAFAGEKRIANHVQDGLIHPVSMYRIISHFSDLRNSAGFADSVVGLTDEAIRLILKCLKRGGTIQECKKQVGRRIASKMVRPSGISLSTGDYRKLKAIADRRRASVPATAKWLVEKWMVKNLSRIWAIETGDVGGVRRVANKWLVRLMLPQSLDSAVKSYAQIVGRTPSDVLKEVLRAESDDC